MSKGTVFWVTGLAGAGKTTIGREVLTLLKERARSAVFLDGDELRELFVVGENQFTLEERRRLAGQYAHLCKMLSDQGIDVVCATISMFPDVRSWARENIDRFTLVYVKAPMETLRRRDQKGLYSRAERGEISNVMGIDLAYHEPENPDVVLTNDDHEDPAHQARHIVDSTIGR